MSEELHRLAVEKHEAERELRGFGYMNMAGLSEAELVEVAKRRADLEARVAVTTGRYRRHLAALAETP